MKRLIVSAGVILAAVAAIVCAGAQDSPEVQRAIGLQRGTLVAEVAALQDLRQGKTADAIDRLESHCYSTAVILLESPTWKTNSTVRLFVAELEQYRKQHAQPESEWTPTEKRLEELLKEMKEDKKINTSLHGSTESRASASSSAP